MSPIFENLDLREPSEHMQKYYRDVSSELAMYDEI